MADWRGALTYPFCGPEGERPVLALWILLLLAMAVPRLRYVNAIGLLGPLVVAVPVVGYLGRLLVASEKADPAPALLADFPGLVRRGVGGLVISLCYLAIPFLLLAVTIYGALYTERVPDPGSFSTLTIYAGSTAVLCLALVGAYLLPIGLATYGRTDSLRSAFAGRTLRPVITKGAYFAGWTAAFGTFGFVAAIATSVAGATRFGPLVATGLLAYTSMLTVHVWGRALARAR